MLLKLFIRYNFKFIIINFTLKIKYVLKYYVLSTDDDNNLTEIRISFLIKTKDNFTYYNRPKEYSEELTETY